MKELLQKIEKRMDDFTVKKKLYILYIFCVLLPLIITDSVVFLIIRNSEMEKQKHDMTNIANAVSYNISSVVNNAGEMAKTIYTSRYIDDFLSRKYDTSAQYHGIPGVFQGYFVRKSAGNESDCIYDVYEQ